MATADDNDHLNNDQEQLDALRKAETNKVPNFEMSKSSLKDEIKYVPKDLVGAKKALAARWWQNWVVINSY